MTIDKFIGHLRKKKTLSSFESTRKILKRFSEIASHVTQFGRIRKLRKMKKNQKLLKYHREERIKWVNVMSWDDEWKQITFPDLRKEKKKKNDGPNGYKYYWHTERMLLSINDQKLRNVLKSVWSWWIVWFTINFGKYEWTLKNIKLC